MTHASAPLLFLAALLTGLGATGCRSDPPQDEQATGGYDALDEAARRQVEHALDGLQAGRGLAVTLFASEPMLINPTNIDVDARGRVWVCEAQNYRPAFNPEQPYRSRGDRILILEDHDGDGRADTSKVYYQGEDVNAALGIAVLGNRTIVSATPNVLVFTDFDGDDRPDRKDTLFTGIRGVQDDHSIHAVVFGPDGRLYFNFGNAGYQLLDKHGRPVRDPQGHVVAAEGQPYRQGMAFRANPDGTDVEVLGHNFRNPYELTVDSYGTVWQSDNDDDGNRSVRINYVMEYGNFGYVDEMTGAGWRTRRVGMSDEIPRRHWHQNDPGVVPNLLVTGAGSPTGIVVYEDTLLPEVYRNQLIHADAGPGVVRAYPVEPDGAGFWATTVDVLTSRDRWFRPSDVAVAPDGSLIVADWYDAGVGGNQMADVERGRLYRIAPPRTPYHVPELDVSTAEGAAEALQSPNMATRYLAHAALRRQGAAAAPALRALWEHGAPRMRARALWLLGRLPAHRDSVLQAALQDDDPDLRVAALRVARQVAPRDVLDYARQAAADPSPQVRREAALALRTDGTDAAAAVWATLAQQHDGADRWYLEALGIGAGLHPDAYFDAWLAEAGDSIDTPGGRDLAWRIRARSALPLLLDHIRDTTTAEEDVERFLRAVDFQTDPAKETQLASLLGGDHPHQPTIDAAVLARLSPDFARQSPQVQRTLEAVLPKLHGTAAYLTLVRNLELTGQQDALFDMVMQGQEADLQAEAAALLLQQEGQARLQQVIAEGDEADRLHVMNLLGRLSHAEANAMLWRYFQDASHPLALRRKALEAMGSNWEGQHRLYDLWEADSIPAPFAPTVALRLLSAWDPPLRAAAQDYLDRTQPADALPSINQLVLEKGDAEAGQQAFAQLCASCHRVGDTGTAFGPALTEIGDKLSKHGLYEAILHPSAAISFGYEGYAVTLADGTVAVGYIESETADQLTLRTPGGVSKTIPRADVATMEEMTTSLMPEGLHQALTHRQLVDLVTYLASLKKSGGTAATP